MIAPAAAWQCTLACIACLILAAPPAHEAATRFDLNGAGGGGYSSCDLNPDAFACSPGRIAGVALGSVLLGGLALGLGAGCCLWRARANKLRAAATGGSRRPHQQQQQPPQMTLAFPLAGLPPPYSSVHQACNSNGAFALDSDYYLNCYYAAPPPPYEAQQLPAGGESQPLSSIIDSAVGHQHEQQQQQQGQEQELQQQQEQEQQQQQQQQIHTVPTDLTNHQKPHQQQQRDMPPVC